MEIFSALLAICAGNSPVTGEFPTQRPVTWSFDVYFDLRPNERLSKQWWGWWFETLFRSLWRHRNVYLSMPLQIRELLNGYIPPVWGMITYPCLKFSAGSYLLVSVHHMAATRGLFYQHDLTFIPAWISYYIHHKVWDEITCPFPYFNSASKFISHITRQVISYPCFD